MEHHRNDRVERDAARQVRGDLAGDEGAELGSQAALAAVLQAVDGLAERAGVRARAADRDRAGERDGVAEVTAAEAEPAAGIAAAGAARREDEVGEDLSCAHS